MSRVCEICGKRPTKGNSIVRTGLPKKTGGFGLKTTGITRRTFYPNLQVVKVTVKGTVKRIRLCTKCLKKGNYAKA
jgi:large subunit ribosomal protein L28